MEQKKFRTSGVCSRSIAFALDGDSVKNVTFEGGCAGNLLGIGTLVEGMNIDEVIKRLRGIDCSGKGTSCPDQLAKALEEIKQ